MEIQGKVKFIGETETFGNNGFRKREIVVTTDEQYPQHIMVEFVQDKCDILNGYQVGQDVKIGINLRGREWINPQGESKYFNSIQGWRIEKLESTPQNLEQAKGVIDEAFEPAGVQTDEQDDLPF